LISVPFNFFLVSLFKFVEYASFPILNIFLVYLLSSVEYANYAFFITLLFSIISILPLGTSDLVLKRGFNYKSGEFSPKKYLTFIKSTHFIFLFTSLIYSLIFSFFSFENELLSLLFFSPVLSLLILHSKIFQSLRLFALSSFSASFFKLTFVFSTLLFYYLGFFNLKYIFYTSIALVIFLISYNFHKIYYITSISNNRFNFFRYTHFFHILRSSFGFLAYNLIQIIKNYGEIFLLAFLGSSIDLASFHISYTLSLSPILFSTIFLTFFSPIFALQAKSSKYAIFLTYQRLRFYIILFSIILYLFIFLFITFFLLPNLDQSYSSILSLFSILVAARIPSVLIGPANHFLQFFNDHIFLNKLLSYYSIFKIVSAIVFFYFFNIYGVCFSILISNVIYSFFLYKRILFFRRF